MKSPSVKSILVNVLPGFVLVFPFVLLNFKAALITVLASLALFFILLIVNDISIYKASLLMVILMFSMVLAFKYGLLKEGFLDKSPDGIVSRLQNMKRNEGFKDKEEDAEDESNEPGSKAEVDGYEDVKVEKNEKPAPAMKADENPMPFKLGEIPSQAKGGPHIDAGSTLMKAIKSLNPDQINAMSKDTQQLIETQKSLMGMFLKVAILALLIVG
jgi:hypothetical protein